MQIEAAHVLAGVGKVAVAQSKHAGKLVDTRLSELVYEQAPLLCQIQVVNQIGINGTILTLMVRIMVIMMVRYLRLFDMILVM